VPVPEETTPANPIVAAILQGSAPLTLRLSAARGVLPLLRADLIRILIVLLRDGEGEVRREAAARLAAIPEGEVIGLAGDASAPEDLLDHYGCDPASRSSVRDAIFANPATPARTLRKMAPLLTTAQIDQALMNQTRLIEMPDLLDLMSANPALSAPQRSRIEEMRRHFLGAPSPRTSSQPAEPDVVTHAPARTEPEPVETPEREDDEEVEKEGAVDEEAKALFQNATQKILRMNVAEKIQLSLKGNREERLILIKDASKLVQEAVIQSPKLTENEVEAIARMRSATEDVLRIIAGSRDWMKNYTVVHALATNPKTPTGIAMNLVTRLTNRDLKILSSDRNVAEIIRRQARKITQQRNQSPGH
jgi:hypothetical protein